jgi:hypothetical protein
MSVVGNRKINYSVLSVIWGNSGDRVHEQLRNMDNPKPILYSEKKSNIFIIYITHTQLNADCL